LKKGRPFAGLFACAVHPALFRNPADQQTVDGSQRALEMSARSSYVPNSAIGVRSRFPEDARPEAARINALGMPIWMK
jgi:hypothetical protein